MYGQINYLKNIPELGQEYYCLFPFKHPSYMVLRWENKYFEKRLFDMHRLYRTLKDLTQASTFVYNFFITHKEQLKYLTSESEPGTKVWYGFNMDSDTLDSVSINFNPENDFHQKLYNRFYFYRTCEDLIQATNLITKVLEEEYERDKIIRSLENLSISVDIKIPNGLS